MLPSLPKDMFVTICCHDVRDDVLPDVDPDPYAINTRNLVALFDWFKALRRIEWVGGRMLWSSCVPNRS